MAGCISTVFVDERSSFYKGDITVWASLKLSVPSWTKSKICQSNENYA
jgi:hypothetical protein